jgi:hypothetical protein
MADQSFEFDVLADLLDEAATVGLLAGDEKTFTTAYEAFSRQDRETFQSTLQRLQLTARCRLVCEWIRVKQSVFLCLKLCGTPEATDTQPDPRQLATAIVRVTQNEKLVLELAQIVERGDAAAFERLVAAEKLQPFCHFFCFWLCLIRYRLLCRWMCDPTVAAMPNLATEIATAGHALRVLVSNEKAFAQAVAGAQSGNAAEVKAAIDSVNLTAFCRLICEWFCSWNCVRVCIALCRQFPVPAAANEVHEAFLFAQATRTLGQNPLQLEELSGAVGAGDVKTFGTSVTSLKLEPFCIQLCHWICFLRCQRYCILICPPPDTTPLFTHVGIYAIPTTSSAGDFAADGTTTTRLAFTKTIPLEGIMPDGQALQAYEYRFLVDPAASPPTTATTPAAGAKVAPTTIGQLEFWAYDNTLNVWYPDTRPVGVNTAFGSYNIPQPGSTFISTGPLDVSVDPAGWIQVPRMNNYTQGGIGRFVPGGGLAGTDALINLDTTQFTNETKNLGALTAGSAIPAADLSPRPTFTITFEARVHGTTALVATNTLKVIAFSNTMYTYTRHSDWDGGSVSTQDVCSLDIKELTGAGAGCSKLTTVATALFTCYHPYLASAEVWLQGPTIPYPPVAGPFTFTPALPPYGPGAVDVPSGPGGHVFTISGLPSCAYILHLETTVNLTTGDGPIGYENEDLMAFCTETGR